VTQPPPDLPPPTVPPPPAASPSGTSTGLDPKLAGLLSYFLWAVTGLLFLITEKTNSMVRFHAAQSIVASVAIAAAWIFLAIVQWILGSISWFLSWIVGIFFALAFLAFWVFMMYKGYRLERYKLPIIGDFAEQLAAKQF
jgi:uncharacterized membrane protein